MAQVVEINAQNYHQQKFMTQHIAHKVVVLQTAVEVYNAKIILAPLVGYLIKIN